MRLKYKHQSFQTEAVRTVTQVFAGQVKGNGQSDHIIDPGKDKTLFNRLGYGNHKISLPEEAICDNIRKIQSKSGLKPIECLQHFIDNAGFALTLEMETGTGKTYTYIKTMYELNAQYGWTKFVIVVPSIAIREGVKQSLDNMREHFNQEYNSVPMQSFVYSSKQLNAIQAFAEDAGIHVMIINTQAFNSSMDEEKSRGGRGDKTARIIFDRRDDFQSRRPIDVLAQCHPIMIIDEPQSVLGADKGNKTRKGLSRFQPLFTLLYSATHRKGDIYNMVFRLDALDAYNQKLVKKIEVKGINQIGTTATNSYVYLESIIISKGNPQARISFDRKTATGTTQISVVVGEGYDLYAQSGELEEYKDRFILDKIDGVNRKIHFTNGTELYEGDACGKANEDIVRRIQIRETIRTHFERERQLYPKGIKVLSLFFIDHVGNYRLYDGDEQKGKFAKMFEEEYNRVKEEMMPSFSDAKYSEYLNNSRNSAEKVHQGYFSMDKKGKSVDSKDKEGENEERAFDLIMKDKERLLSLNEPVRFIFSHSALKEGWDNPNVFQICTLKNSNNETKKRQEVGRGMRLCVNQFGDRQDADVLYGNVHNINVLTVIASESYDSFAKQLQTEMAEACGDRPIVVTANLFVETPMVNTSGEKVNITTAEATEIQEELVINGYIRKGALTEKYYNDKKNGTLNFGEVNDKKDYIVKVLDTVFNPTTFKPDNARGPQTANFVKENFDKKEFQELWKRINRKTYYQVNFDTSDLIKKSIKALDDHLKVTEIRVIVEDGSLEKISDKEQLASASAMTKGKTRTIKVSEAVGSNIKYDLIGKLVSATGLTRKTIVAILQGIRLDTFSLFKMNPEEFIIRTGLIINDCKALAVIEHIKYEKLTDEYGADIFETETIKGIINQNALESHKSLYDLVVVDSMGVEKEFAKSLENEDDVVVYTKLPSSFYINTPMGKYNPDWAVAFREGSVKHVYFIAETKGNSLQTSQLRGSEDAKIDCFRRHFEAISESDIVFSVVNTYKDMYDLVTK